MLSIGEFSKICNVSTKTLRYYAEIGLLQPEVIKESGYRYYRIEQLKTMLFIERLKSYQCTLEEIKQVLTLSQGQEEALFSLLKVKQQKISAQQQQLNQTLTQLSQDLDGLWQGSSIMAYLNNIKVTVVEVADMHLVSIRKHVLDYEFPKAYQDCFTKIMEMIQSHGDTMVGPPMVLFHSEEFTCMGMDSEFAIPIKEANDHTRLFAPKTCLKSTLCGPYRNVTSIYAKQREVCEIEGYKMCDALFEVYVNDPSTITEEAELCTEIYSPIRKTKKAGSYENN